MEKYSLKEIKNTSETNLQLRNNNRSSKVFWTSEFWENATWGNFFSGERDDFLFNNSFDLPNEIKEIQRLLLVIKNMQVEIEIGNEKEIDFLAISILIDAYRRLYIEKTPIEKSYFDDFIHPYGMASSSIRNLWSIKRRTFIIEQIVHYLGDAYNTCENSIIELRKFAKGEIYLQTWEIYSLIGDLPIVSIPSTEYEKIQQMVPMLSYFNNLSIDFYTALRDKTNLEKQGADIMHSHGIWFDSYGGFDRLICETSKSMVDEAELEEAMLSALKKKFVPRRNETYKSAFNSFLRMLGASKINDPNELQLENSQLKSLPDVNMLENKMALALRNQNKR